MDNGCGTGEVAKTFMNNFDQVIKDSSVIPQYNIFKNIESLDIVSKFPFIKEGNMSQLPFENGSFDLVLFSLSLMNTNFVIFIEEALRVLKENGYLVISKHKLLPLITS